MKPGYNDFDGISLTAALKDGFNIFGSLTAGLKMNTIEARKASDMCNRRGEVLIYKTTNPAIFFVPKTRGQKEETFLIKDLLDACSHCKVKRLMFTHYIYLMKQFPEKEVASIFSYIKENENIDLQTMIWEIDSNFYDSFLELYHQYFPKND
ncbi:hypothetical protein ACQV4P_18270 [Leptospira levettii]